MEPSVTARAARRSTPCRSSGRSSGRWRSEPARASRSVHASHSALCAGRRPMVDAPIVELEAEAGVVWLRLNRPEALNALNRRLTGALEATLERVAAMDDTRVLVVAGRGRAFCAGNDIKEMQS